MDWLRMAIAVASAFWAFTSWTRALASAVRAVARSISDRMPAFTNAWI